MNQEMSNGAEPALVEKVKTMCRSDPDGKVQWCAWCDANVGGTKDPSRMDSETLQLFFADYEAGVLHKVSAAGGGRGGAKADQPELAETVKIGQRVSASWKNAWVMYCDLKGNTVYDPIKHTMEFLQSFLEYLGAQATASLQDAAPQPVAPMLKRPRPSAEVAAAAAPKRPRLMPVAPTAASAATQTVAELAAEVKRLQREDPRVKQQWSDYCDLNVKGVKDPMRHTEESLSAFLQGGSA
eukprot:CAMPEP_0197877984 /NCGR_PEP_ID=MMETSP1439-20131203/6498_1 /TAXON_ID=66791 /ORGANISM="Gonyaulax spinifera, Strain CCMP409" /LENGTH=239 /DNA_ID=CAMNT_0043497363 /DNA_START=87 /DNA_END=806 /DNA_ORIENTATION=+